MTFIACGCVGAPVVGVVVRERVCTVILLQLPACVRERAEKVREHRL